MKGLLVMVLKSGILMYFVATLLGPKWSTYELSTIVGLRKNEIFLEVTLIEVAPFRRTLYFRAFAHFICTKIVRLRLGAGESTLNCSYQNLTQNFNGH